MRRSRSEGFTLIEVLVVASVISILASIAVPSFVRARASANEGSVIATLRSITKAQFQFKSLDLVDVDLNGGYEYGSLGEITGKQLLRGSTVKLAPRLLSESLGDIDPMGRLTRHGYYLAMHLPDAAGVGLPEVAASLPNIDPRLAADFWTCVAWPATNGTTGRWAFFVNQQGQVLKTRAAYGGTAAVPPPGCGLVGVAPNVITSQQLAIGVPGADGNNWVPVH